jgi:hydroxymethylglutaryl-CoA synthase
MVQKSFLNLVLQDIALYKDKAFSKEIVEQMQAVGFKADVEGTKVLMKHFGKDWKDKCERSLLLAKQLGNIYTGSLYNGILSLIGDKSIDLKGKRIMMFSYGSGCAASMFMIKVNGDYSKIQEASEFKNRLGSRLKISPEEFDKWMAHRESIFGKAPYDPSVNKGIFYDY